MPRQPRFFAPATPQHLIQRGNNRAPMFGGPPDFAYYKGCLEYAARKHDVAIHAYVLMTNHVHLLATPAAATSLPRMMQAVGRVYVQYFNRAYARTGTLWRIMDGRYYKREVDAVVAELKTIPEKYVFFVDDEPFVDPKRMWALGRAIEAADLDKHYFAYSRIDSLLRDLDLMKLWHKIGLRRLLFGIETVFDYELKEYNKRQQREEIVQGLKAAREIGISLFCNFIINPNYGKREFEELTQFIRDNNVDYPSFTILTPIPGTDASEKIRNLNLTLLSVHKVDTDERNIEL